MGFYTLKHWLRHVVNTMCCCLEGYRPVLLGMLTYKSKISLKCSVITGSRLYNHYSAYEVQLVCACSSSIEVGSEDRARL